MSTGIVTGPLAAAGTWCDGVNTQEPSASTTSTLHHRRRIARFILTSQVNTRKSKRLPPGISGAHGPVEDNKNADLRVRGMPLLEAGLLLSLRPPHGCSGRQAGRI